ncbi:MAG: hypothetical protein L6V81_11240 [Clostridium sp.]|nr:MAG: hypothetical protein L6V81_11240 [Clostridium sp.]
MIQVKSNTGKNNVKDYGEQFGPTREVYEKNKPKWWTNLLTILSKKINVEVTDDN